jgi:hypothetical protein
MGREEVVVKAHDLIEPVLGGAQSRRLIASILALDESADIRSLRPLLQRPLRQ